MNRVAGPVRALVLTLTLAGCAVGPTYRTPPVAAGEGYVSAEALAQGAGDQRFDPGAVPGQAWWKAFGSPALDALVAQALAHSPTLASAQATLRAARQGVVAARGGLSPTVQVGDSRTWERYSSIPGQPGAIYAVTTAQVSVVYSFDLFGGQRRAIESAKAQAEAARFEAVGAADSLSANVVASTLKIAALDAQAAATRAIMDAQARQLALVQDQLAAGSASLGDRVAAEAQLEAARGALAGLDQSLDAARHQLAILIGQSPAQPLPPLPALADLALPRDLPVSLPSTLVAQRPDIRAQAARLHQACAQVGVADAAVLPQISLSGGYATNLWSLTAGVSQTLFQGGALNAERKAAVDRYQAAQADYRSVVLLAFQNVADVLSALGHDAAAEQAALRALDDADSGLTLAQDRNTVGAVGLAPLLAAQTQAQQARVTWLQARAARAADTVALFQALGGGWG